MAPYFHVVITNNYKGLVFAVQSIGPLCASEFDLFSIYFKLYLFGNKCVKYKLSNFLVFLMTSQNRWPLWTSNRTIGKFFPGRKLWTEPQSGSFA
jgi:hypothetical protein